MFGHELKAIISEYESIQKNFLGVFSIDTLPKNIPLHHFLFCNEDLAHNHGKHWLCFVRPSKKTVECFDSLSINPEKYQLLRKYCHFKNVKEIKFNQTQFQPSSSQSCGLYALYFAINRMHNLDLSFKTFLNDFFKCDHEANERKVTKFFE